MVNVLKGEAKTPNNCLPIHPPPHDVQASAEKVPGSFQGSALLLDAEGLGAQRHGRKDEKDPAFT